MHSASIMQIGTSVGQGKNREIDPIWASYTLEILRKMVWSYARGPSLTSELVSIAVETISEMQYISKVAQHGFFPRPPIRKNDLNRFYASAKNV